MYTPVSKNAIESLNFCGKYLIDIWISETKLDDFYHSGFSDYLYRYIHNVSADMSSGLLQVFVELRRLHGTSNNVLYLIHRVHLFWLR